MSRKRSYPSLYEEIEDEKGLRDKASFRKKHRCSEQVIYILINE